MRCSTDPPCLFSINNLLCFKVSLWVLAISALSLSFVVFLIPPPVHFLPLLRAFSLTNIPANRKKIEKKIIIFISDAFSNKCFFFCVLSENKSNLPT